MFIRTLRARLALMIKQNGFIASMTLMLVFSAASFVYNAAGFRGSDISAIVDGYHLLATVPESHYRGFFEMLFPFLAIMPFCFSYMTDRDRNNICAYAVRGGRTNYYLSSAATAFAGSFIIIFVPLLIDLLLNVTIFPLNSMLDHTNSPTFSIAHINEVWTHYIGASLFVSHPFLHCLLWVLIPSLFSGIVGVFVYSLSFFVKRFKILLFLPFYGIHYVLSTLGEDFYYIKYICHLERFETFEISMKYFFALCIAMTAASVVIITIKIKSDEL